MLLSKPFYQQFCGQGRGRTADLPIFSQSPLDRSRTTWHFACCGYVTEALETPKALELLDSSLDTAQVEQQTIIGRLGSLRYV